VNFSLGHSKDMELTNDWLHLSCTSSLERLNALYLC
jgi:hypothetical protein